MRRREYHWNLYHVVEKNELESLRTDQVEAVFAAIPRALHPEWFIWKEGLDSWRPLDDFPELLKSLRNADTRIVEKPPPFPGEKSYFNEPVVNVSPSVAATAEPSIATSAPATPTGAAPVATTVTAASDDGATRTGVDLAPPSARSQKAPQQSVIPTSPLMIENEPDASHELSLMRAGVLEDRLNMRFDKHFEIRIFSGDEVFKNATVDISLKGMRARDPLPKSLPRYFNVEIMGGAQRIHVVCSEVRANDGKHSRRLKIESNENASGLLTLLLSGG